MGCGVALAIEKTAPRDGWQSGTGQDEGLTVDARVKARPVAALEAIARLPGIRLVPEKESSDDGRQFRSRCDQGGANMPDVELQARPL